MMENWQRDLWAALSGSGAKEMKIYIGGRQIGKSVMSQMWNSMLEENPPYVKIADAIVDGSQWYTIKCNKEIASWVREQPGQGVQWDQLIDNQWYIHYDSFDMHEELYMMLKLKWGA